MHRTLATTVLAGLIATGVALPAQAATVPTPSGPPLQAVLSLGRAPGAADAVRAYALSNGLRVVASGPGYVVVRGASSLAHSLFGTTAAPQVPPALADVVTSVAGLDPRPLFHHLSVPSGYTGADMDSAYAAPGGSSAGKGLTVATVQFSGWHASDVTTYAQAAGIPISSGQITAVPVDGADPTAVDGSGGDVEVAMDVEAVLAVAPAAKQRIYFAPNTLDGAVAAYKQIAADAAAGLVQVVSDSWGGCEAQDGASVMQEMATPIQQIVANGATFFASSGDYGAYGCRTSASDTNSTISPIFPASLPQVVAVGGTSLTRSGSGWSESAWSSSGGGQSSVFSRPSYQANLPLSGSGRLVPDVAADADPNTGMGIYASSANGWVWGGGTSLASPLWAGTLAATLAANGHPTGIGDIHTALYANSADLRDVTSGNNGTYGAGPGYDEVTGLGSPQWSKLGPALIAATQPAPTSTSGGSGGTTTTTSGSGSGSTTGTSGTGSTGGTTGTSGTGSTGGTTGTSGTGGTGTTTGTDPTSGSPTPTSPIPTSPTPTTGTTAPAPRSTVNSCPSGSVPPDSFTDVPASDVFGPEIACVTWWGVAHGTTATTYAPGSTVNRGQMASFIARLVTASGGVLPTNAPVAFRDVVGNAFESDIDALAQVGIVQGDSSGYYYPNQVVDRDQMAAFLARAYAFVTGGSLPPSTVTFPDTIGNTFAQQISQVAGVGIAAGYSDGTYRPSLPVTREQMASFLARLLDLLVSQGYAATPA